MHHALCQTCLQPYRLMISASEVNLIRQISDSSGHTAPCPRKCGGTINLVGDATIDAMTEKLKPPMSITGVELFRAVNGMGLPDEIVKDIDTFQALLIASKVVGAVVDLAGEGRIYLHELHLENGMTIHLSAGLKGAEVLKITKRGVPHGG